MTPRFPLAVAAMAAASVASWLPAQDYRSLMIQRQRPLPWGDVFQVRAGLRGGVPQDEDTAVGLESDTTLDGHIFWRAQRIGERTDMNAYVGRDGAYLGLTDSDVVGQGTASRLEFATRYFPFWREGYYRGDSFVPTGRYEGNNYEIRLGFSQDAGQGMNIELGGFYRRYDFDRNDQTAASYVIPQRYNAYGVRITAEQNTLELGPVYGRPESGFIITLVAEREQNDSDQSFGVPGVWEAELASGFWRGEGRLEWYAPNSQSTFWEILIDARLSDREDRIVNYDAQHAPGHLTVDGELRFRIDWEALSVTPFAKGQFLKIAEESGLGSDQKVFFGGGLDLRLDLGQNFTLVGEYSYLNNEFREPIGVDEDLYGEHMFFVGGEFRFGASRR